MTIKIHFIAGAGEPSGALLFQQSTIRLARMLQTQHV
jgi:hypothetical protein